MAEKSPGRPIRVIVAKVGLDGHDRGVRVVARALQDAGMEVIYLGLRQTPGSVAEAALQEDADVVGVSLLSAAHMTILPRVQKELADRGLGHVLLTGGGVIPEEDMAALADRGVGRLFGPGTPLTEFVEYMEEEVAARRAKAGEAP
ncbi:MAG: cobalamin B12-binding domain-containing protein [Gemmatimonadota bacterium]|nr:methylmalonyl-CoA mutase [Gemmatimonadota bacterium]MDP6460332.1 cobalamin B12-binding domain-containing protein [Gemmatimonadota bacterium]MDP6530141.1 cobalamin B12-binding domain-containing protein [Gemmatimonadota bacterium]MDP6803368.1 cobalamin B12-binding domain-containing protein [Gemmatimonadota bacterium]MDP7032774.1 cobalamin B12-binding domain-containing protein [Gemmatimonadota bacterium]